MARFSAVDMPAARTRRACVAVYLAVASSACAPGVSRPPPAPTPGEIPLLRAALARDASDVATRVRLAEAYRLQGQAEVAQQLLEPVAASEPAALLYLGLVYEDLERFADARRLYQEFLQRGRSAGGGDASGRSCGVAVRSGRHRSAAHGRARAGPAAARRRRAVAVTELSAQEMDVAGVIAADLLPFAISSWGTGGGIGVNAAAAVPIGFDMAVGASGGYVVAREFEPRSDASFAYRPGNQLHVRAALDRSFGAAGKASLQLVYQQFSQDRSGGSNLYQAGDRLQAVVSYAFAAGAGASGIVYGGYLRRQQGRYTEVVLLTPAQDLIYGGAAVRVPVRTFVLLPALDARVLGNEAGLEQGHTIAAGVGAEFALGRIQLAPMARARFGSLTIRQGLDSGFTGLELGFTVRTTRRAMP